jgi:hypothetical protein
MGKIFVALAATAFITLAVDHQVNSIWPSVFAQTPAAQSTAVARRDTSLLGTDDDNNGVRDDIDAYIATLHPDLQLGATLTARVQQEILATDIDDVAAARSLGAKFFDEYLCLTVAARQLEARGITVYTKRINDTLRSMTFDTKQRADKDKQFDLKLSGGSYRLGECDVMRRQQEASTSK